MWDVRYIKKRIMLNGLLVYILLLSLVRGRIITTYFLSSFYKILLIYFSYFFFCMNINQDKDSRKKKKKRGT